MSARVLVGYFADEHNILSAARAAREAGLPVHDVYTPYAVHGMDEAMGLRPSRLTWVCFGAGLAGLLIAWALQHFTSVIDWPIIVGGKPHNSIPAFIPVAFELTVLVAGLTTVAALLARSLLFPGSKGVALPRVTDDRFALAITPVGPGFDAEVAVQLMREHGAVETTYAEVAR